MQYILSEEEFKDYKQFLQGKADKKEFEKTIEQLTSNFTKDVNEYLSTIKPRFMYKPGEPWKEEFRSVVESILQMLEEHTSKVKAPSKP